MISWFKHRLGIGRRPESPLEAAMRHGIRQEQLHRARLDAQEAEFAAALNSGDMSRAWDVLDRQIKANSEEIFNRASLEGAKNV